MNTMMYTTGVGGAFIPWLLHAVAVVVFAVGVLFLAHYAMKRMTDAQVKSWGVGMVVTGVILCLLALVSIPAVQMSRGFGMMQYMDEMGDHMDEMGDHMNEMGDHMNNMMDDHGDMTMAEMSESLEGKSGDALDEAFLRAMIPHHEGAIEMAVMIENNAKHEELRAMAQDIIAAQQREIDQMNRWLRDWGYEE